MERNFSDYSPLLPQNLAKLTFNLTVKANWLSGHRFWYKRDVRLDGGQHGKQFILVDATTGESRLAFDHAQLAEQLGRRMSASGVATGESLTADTLPFDEFDYLNGDVALAFTVGVVRWRCDLPTYQCTRARGWRTPREAEVPSPDGNWVAFLRGHNLFVRSLESGETRALTRDGKRNYNYASRPDFHGTKTLDEIHGRKPRPAVLWSPDSTRILTHRLDQRKVRKLPVVQFVPAGDSAPAAVRLVRYPLPGDSHLPLVEHVILGLEGTRVDVQGEALELRNTDALIGPFWENIWWAKDSQMAYFVHPERGCKTMNFCAVDTNTGEVQAVLEEHSETFLDQDMRWHRDKFPDIRVLSDRNAFLWASQRDGWYHLYLHELSSGQLLHPLTQGEWLVTELLGVDELQGFVYFLGSGREPHRDPYLQHLYRVRLDGTGLELLTPEDADHDVRMAPTLDAFVDTYSRVNQAPVSVLRRSDGYLLATLESADVQLLREVGYQEPEPFVVKAEDGETDLYGVLIRPAQFDPAKQYPVVDYEYGGPQMFNTPKAYTSPTVYGQVLAQMGFAVVILDGRGTVGRSKAFHDFSAGDFGAAGGLVDHVTGVRQLADRFPFLDLNRVGMYGFSGGGYGSARAIMTYPDFYKVAVAACGNHDNRLYDTTWWDRYMGLGGFDQFPSQDNQSLAPRLEGKLLLMHGDIDDNVHPSHTMRLVNALIRANKDFDMLLLPNQGHPLIRDDYVARRVCAYFQRHL